MQDNVQHGIDDNPNNDAGKGAALGGLGGVAVGAAAGSLAGPLGTIVGAIVGGLGGAIGSGAAVAVVDSMDNDNTVTGIGGDNDSHDWDTVSPHYRKGYEEAYGADKNWDENEDAHRYAWEMRNQPDYRDRDYADVETDLRTNWAAQNPSKSWDDVSGSVREGWDTTGQVLRLHKEELHADKQKVQAGEVSVRKEVVTETKTLEVPVTREEVVIERHTVTDGGISTGDLGDGETIRIPVMEEQVTLQTTAVATEEVSIGKREIQETREVSGEVRHEEVVVDREGNPTVRE